MRASGKVSSTGQAPAGPAAGAACLVAGYRMLLEPGLKRFVLVPLAVNTAVFTLLGAWLGRNLDRALERLLPDWLAWLEWLLWPLFVLALLLVAVFLFTLLGNLIAGPFNGLLSERVERHLTGRTSSGNGSGPVAVLTELPAAVAGELRKWAYFLGWMVLLALAALVPLVNALWPLLWGIFGAWSLALEFLDFPLGNRGLDFRTQRAWLRRHRAAGLGFGAAALAAALVPVLNFALMPAAVTGATVLVVRCGDGADRPESGFTGVR